MELNIYRVNFLGTLVRVIERDGKVFSPIVDIAKAIDYSRRAIHQMIKRNSDILESFTVNITLTVKKGKGGQYLMENTCLSRDGIIAILLKITPSRIKDSQKRNRIIKFQQWAIQTLGEVADGKIPSAFVLEEYAQLLQVKPGHMLGEAVRNIAKADELSRATVYRRLQKLRGFPYKIYSNRKSTEV